MGSLPHLRNIVNNRYFSGQMASVIGLDSKLINFQTLNLPNFPYGIFVNEWDVNVNVSVNVDVIKCGSGIAL